MLSLWTLPLNSPGASANPGHPSPERDKPQWLCLFRLVLGCLQSQRGVMISRPQSAIFFRQLFKLTFEEKATRNAILRVEIRCFSECLTYLKQRTVKWTASGTFDQEGSGAGMGLCDWFQERGAPGISHTVTTWNYSCPLKNCLSGANSICHYQEGMLTLLFLAAGIIHVCAVGLSDRAGRLAYRSTISTFDSITFFIIK